MINDCTGSEREIIMKLAAQRPGCILDIGCGTGEKTFSLAGHAQRIVGIDPDEKRIRSAQKRFDQNNLTFLLCRAESIAFSDCSFSTVLFTESLHHVPYHRQIRSLKEAWRVAESNGKVLIIEPVYGKGSFEEIFNFYHDEKESRINALKAMNSLTDTMFHVDAEEEIHIVCSCSGIDDLYVNGIGMSPQANDSLRQNTMEILYGCERTPEGDFLIDYYACVWLLSKIE
jgi:2-polyprenyl-3-methyl-5-hydroxy-6-metoxy-1,4-benzoquinol methylase